MDWLYTNPIAVAIDEFQSLIVGLVAVGFTIWMHFHDRRRK